MKFTFLFTFLLLSSYHIHAQEAKKEVKDIPTIRVDAKPTETIITIAEQMPMFRDSTCMNLTSRNEQKACADQQLLKFIFAHMRYPNYLKEMGMEGMEATVIISFIVNTDGSLSDFKILRGNDPPLFAQEFIRVIQLTTEKNGPWIPAMLRGQAVPLRMNIPCKLNLR